MEGLFRRCCNKPSTIAGHRCAWTAQPYCRHTMISINMQCRQHMHISAHSSQRSCNLTWSGWCGSIWVQFPAGHQLQLQCVSLQLAQQHTQTYHFICAAQCSYACASYCAFLMCIPVHQLNTCYVLISWQILKGSTVLLTFCSIQHTVRGS
jgi:hypothetical protein